VILVVASTLLVATLVSLRLFRLAVLPSAYLALITLCLLVVGIYRVVQTFSSQATDDVRKPVAFWICQIFFELCVCRVSTVGSSRRARR
jgi:hypothetical protein